MNFQTVQLVNVFYTPLKEKIFVGRLALKDRKILFEYDAKFMKLKLPIAPLTLPLKPGIFSNDGNLFDGLFGVFNDSLPDGWGRLLIDRNLVKNGVNYNKLSPLDRLCFVGSEGMGALGYEPETSLYHLPIEIKSIDQLAKEAHEIVSTDKDRYVEELLHLNGSSNGARPKIFFKIKNTQWLIKFRSSFDPKDAGPQEYCYHLMAQKAGLDVAPAKLFESKSGYGFFGSRRFDREGDQRIHVTSLSGLMHIDHRVPSLDYESIVKVTQLLCQDIRECEKQFRLCVFNVLANNRDDHAKNFSFVMNQKGKWSVSFCYDLTFSMGPFGEHSTTVMGEGRIFKMNHLLKLGQIAGLDEKRSKEIIETVSEAVNSWRKLATKYGVQKSNIRLIDGAIQQSLKDLK